MTCITQGYAIANFAFDVGYEVQLERLRERSDALPIPKLSSRKRQTPTYLQFAKPPHILPLGTTNAIPGLPGEVHATVFDFGAVSLTYRWPLGSEESPLPLQELPKLSQTLYHADLEEASWKAIQELMDTKLKPVIVKPELSNLVEDYFVYVIERAGADAPGTASNWLQAYGGIFAQVLNADTSPLSPQQLQEALHKSVSYYENDLAIIDWNSAIIIDSDYADTLSVLEFLNVELLEARYIDAQLDKRLKQYESFIQGKLSRRFPQRIQWYLPFYEPYQNIIEELAELRIESALLAERVDNALKLIGDLYLARIHKAASERFYMHEWDHTISRKLDIIGNLYQLLTDRGNTAQAQTLEMIIILLILIEILMGWVKLH
jgi:hypothetical protein